MYIFFVYIRIRANVCKIMKIVWIWLYVLNLCLCIFMCCFVLECMYWTCIYVNEYLYIYFWRWPMPPFSWIQGTWWSLLIVVFGEVSIWSRGFFPVFASLKLIPFWWGGIWGIKIGLTSTVNPIVPIQRFIFFQAKLMFFQHEICMNENIMEIFLVGKSNTYICIYIIYRYIVSRCAEVG